MTTVLALCLQKGGVGKTTTTLNLGVGLAQRGKRVLLIDLDPQANLTQGLGIDSDGLDYSVYEVLLNPEQGSEFATVHTDAGIYLVPSTLALAGAELELAGKVGREKLLAKALRATKATYDYIVIDSPPSLGLFTLNALSAAQAVIVPLQAHAYALKAMPQLQATIDLVNDINAGIHIGGIVLTMVNKRTNLSQLVEAQAREQYGDLVFKTTIPLTTKLAEAPATGEDISAYAPGSAGAVAYSDLVGEVIERYG